MTRLTALAFAVATISLLLVTASLADTLVINVTKAGAQRDQRSGMPVVSLTLDRESTQVVGALTTRNVGQPMELRLDGKLLATPVIREPITGGVFQISDSDWSEETARNLAQQLLKPGTRIELITK